MGLGRIALFSLLGIAIHFILLLVIFDIYFVSPIIPGINPIANYVSNRCERLVFISIDGLRIDALLDQDQNHDDSGQVTPFLHQRMKEWGNWGVSKCHLPTESRPGHVALLAGLYEDPSAVTKGWTENPVDFDSIFNRSACSFAWGSPDIVNIFYKGLSHSCSYKYTYEREQDFSGNTMAYDDWVYDHVVHFFESAESHLLYSKPKSFFFLHLLGQDTSGHTHKPRTDRYKENLRNVDRIIKGVDGLFSKIFSNNDTSFVVSADHGMTDWGSHGAGDPSETLTPIVNWGCGFKKRQPSESKLEIEQADITPLLAILLGIPIPVNSVGILPSFSLNLSRLEMAQANFLNAEQIAEQYIVKRAAIEAKSSLYKNFDALSRDIVMDTKKSIAHDIKQGQFASANKRSEALIKLSLEGIKYYQNYFHKILFLATIATYIASILILVLSIKGIELTVALWNIIITAAISCTISCIIYNQDLPITYHAYALLPLSLWGLLSAHFKKLALIIAENCTIRIGAAAAMLLLGIEVLVLGFFERWALSISLTTMVTWFLFQINVRKHVTLVIIWTLSGLSLAIFSMIPVVGKVPNAVLPIAASVLIAVSSMLASFNTSNLSIFEKALAVVRSVLILLAGMNNYLVHSSFFENGTLNSSNALVSWLLLALSLVLLFQPSLDVLTKLHGCFSIMSIPFLLLSISHEGFFISCLFIHLYCWIRLEMINDDVVGTSLVYQQYTRKKLHEGVSLIDCRKAYFFLAYIYIAFFGVGNLATLNSFDPSWVRCFLTKFSPFIMTALILLKVIIPFLAVSLSLRVMTVLLNIRPQKLFILVLIYCNVMGLNFLFLVRNEGSWLDIGSSLSHYVIQQVAIVFLLLLHALAQVIIHAPSNSLTNSKFHSL